MTDEEQDALAAEYVLGTLAADERANADGLIASDATFAELVRQWERRLGELNVMVEAVEPPPQIWDRIKSGLGPLAELGTPPPAPAPIDNLQLPPLMPAAAQLAPTSPPMAETEKRIEEPEEIGAPAASLLPPDEPPEPPGLEPEIKPEAETAAPQPAPPHVAPGADVIDLAGRVRRWRGLAIVAGAIAAGLAALIVVSQVKPGLFGGGFQMPRLIAQGTTPAKPSPATSGSRFVGVLQHDPAAPAFLLTIDPAGRTLTVRRVAAKAEADHSYQLWFIAPHATKPQSLGIVGANEYTQSPLPADFNAAALRGATYAVSFEPPGGSKTGVPTGPILFTGKLVESGPPAGSKT